MFFADLTVILLKNFFLSRERSLSHACIVGAQSYNPHFPLSICLRGRSVLSAQAKR